MTRALALTALVALGACHPPEEPPVPPRPTNPTNATAIADRGQNEQEVIDASIVADAGPPLDASIVELDSGVVTRRR